VRLIYALLSILVPLSFFRFASVPSGEAADWVNKYFQETDVDVCKQASNDPTMYIAETGKPFFPPFPLLQLTLSLPVPRSFDSELYLSPYPPFLSIIKISLPFQVGPLLRTTRRMRRMEPTRLQISPASRPSSTNLSARRTRTEPATYVDRFFFTSHLALLACRPARRSFKHLSASFPHSLDFT
jgi:hypothetical protein